MKHFKELRIKLHTNSKIIIWYAWRRYKKRKAAKAEKKRKAAEAKAKKKGKFGGTRRSVAPPAPSTVSSSPDKKQTSVVPQNKALAISPGASPSVSTNNLLAVTTAIPKESSAALIDMA